MEPRIIIEQLELKYKNKKNGRCICGEILERVDGNLHCWRCYPADE